MLYVREDGYIISSNALPAFSIAPGRDTVINIASYLPAMNAGSTYHVAIRFDLKANETWAAKGFEIASNQFLLQQAKEEKPSAPALGSLVISESEKNISVKGEHFTIGFSKGIRGGFDSYLYNGKEQVKQKLLPDFTRPLTDNDRRGWKPQRKLKQWYNEDLKLLKTAIEKKSNTVVVTNLYSLINDSAYVKVLYTIHNDGVIKVDYTLTVKPGLPNIPKVGMQMGIERSYDNIEWFGRGEKENYIDKNYGSDEGVYKLPINDFMENYVVPQENGNRTDVRWMFLANKQKEGLLVVADSLLSMSAWPYTEENIGNAKHTNKLKDAGLVTLNIDLIQMGVGGNDSWSDVAAPLEKYQVPARDYNYSFYLVP
jgi:beta-galactosidase